MVLKATHLSDRGASNTYLADENDPLIIAHLTYDEPDLSGPPVDVIHAEIAAARALGSTKAFFVNYRNQQTGVAYPGAAQFVNLAGVDWLCSDNYGFQGDAGLAYIYGDLYTAEGLSGPFTTMSGHAARTLYAGPLHKDPITYPGRAVFQFLSTGRINDASPGVPHPRQTAAAYGLQLWSCMINGVAGIVNFSHYFPTRGATILDDTDSVAEGAIAEAVAKIAILENQGGVNVLMDSVKGGRRPFTLRPCAYSTGGGRFDWPTNQPNFAPTTGNQLPPWFEGAEIVAAGDTYRLVVNLHDTLAKTLTDAAWGLTGNSFAAGQVKCFKASAPSVDIFA
jgi:hypothetical protein